MSLPQKALTALGLLARLDFTTLRRQWIFNQRQRILRRQGLTPFVHRAAGYPLVCFPDHPDSVVQFIEGGDDPWELDLLRRWLEPGDSFIDAGANLGLFAHMVAGHFRGEVQVLALEASPDLVARMTVAAGLLGEKNLQPVQVAVGAESGEVMFHLARPGETTVSQSMKIEATGTAGYEQHVLPMRTLAALAGQYIPSAPPAAVKVDIEGAEPLALRGAPSAWLESGGPLWLVEINLPVLARMGFRPEDVIRPFSPTAFELWLLPKYPPVGQPPARIRQFQVDEKFSDAAFYNLIAVPTDPRVTARRARIRSFLP